MYYHEKTQSSENINSVIGAIGGYIALKAAWRKAQYLPRKFKDAKLIAKVNKALYGEKDSTIKELTNLNITGEDISKKYDFAQNAFVDNAVKPRIKYLQNIVKILDKTEDGKELLEIAAREKTTFSSMTSCIIGGSLNPTKNHINVNRFIGLERSTISFAHELNHNKQFNKDMDSMLEVNPYEALLVHKSLEADSLSKEAQIAWQLKEKGLPDFFEAGKKGPYKSSFKAFEAAIEENAENLNNGEARREAFEKWFENVANVVAYELQFKLMDYKNPEALNARGIKAFNGNQSNHCVERLFEQMGKMPNGVNYLTETKKGCPSKDLHKKAPMTYTVEEHLVRASHFYSPNLEYHYQRPDELVNIRPKIKNGHIVYGAAVNLLLPKPVGLAVHETVKACKKLIKKRKEKKRKDNKKAIKQNIINQVKSR